MKFTFETKNKSNYYGMALLLFYIILPFFIEKFHVGFYNLLSNFGINFPLLLDGGVMSLVYCLIIISVITICNKYKVCEVNFNLVNKKMGLNKILLFFLCSEGLNVLTALFNVVRNTNVESVAVPAGSTTISITMVLYTCLIGPVVEELIFRGFLLNSIKKYNESFAIVFTGILFGIMHGNITQALPSICMGILWGYIASKYGVKYSTILHILANTIVCLISINGSYMTLLIMFLMIAMLVCIAMFIKNIKSIKDIFADAFKNITVAKSILNVPLIIWIVFCIAEILNFTL